MSKLKSKSLLSLLGRLLGFATIILSASFLIYVHTTHAEEGYRACRKILDKEGNVAGVEHPRFEFSLQEFNEIMKSDENIARHFPQALKNDPQPFLDFLYRAISIHAQFVQTKQVNLIEIFNYYVAGFFDNASIEKYDAKENPELQSALVGIFELAKAQAKVNPAYAQEVRANKSKYLMNIVYILGDYEKATLENKSAKQVSSKK